MTSSLPIGDFSRATHLSIETLRHYHRVNLLEPADVDPFTGHRRYTTEQIPAVQVIRRFRDLEMPIDEIRSVLRARTLRAMHELIAGHLARLEDSLSRTQLAVAALRDLLDRPLDPAQAPISHRSIPATRAAAVTDVIDMADVGAWSEGALGELRGTISAQAVQACGPAGGIHATELFTSERGQATLFIPCAGRVRPAGRVEPLDVPAAELAIIVHQGSLHLADRAYGVLATHVARHELTADGPTREYYLTGRADTADRSAWRTEIGWPIFPTGGT